MACLVGLEQRLRFVRVCSITDCDREHAARGWCLMHYKRWRNRGTTDPLVRSRASDSPCTIDGCDNPQRARGWCNLHWSRWSRTGDPEKTEHPTHDLDAESRLLYYTRKTDDCWLWEGSQIYSGYGNVCWSEFDTPFVHRIAYMLWVGPIPDGLEIDHLCSVRNCIRPDHLEAVSRAENNRRRGQRLKESH